MLWIRVTRVTSDDPTKCEPVLLNTASIISVEQVQDAVYVYLRDGRHFIVVESLEKLGALLGLPHT
jgi:uncharacterized protein YlzI (FlbEa/FlbD family)